MNERIRAIWETNDSISVVWPETGSPVSVSAKTLEQFAELIVRECLEVSNQAEKQCQHPGTMMKKHFGVEE